MCDSVDGTGREATRNRVLGAAYEVFAEVGIDAATVEAVCAQAHFSRGAFYSNFASKDDLFLELIEKVTNDRMRRAAGFVHAFGDASAAAPMPADPADVVRAIADMATEDRTGVLLMAEVRIRAMRDPAIAEAYRTFKERTLAQIADILGLALRAYGLSPRIASATLARIVLETWETASIDAVIAGEDAAGISALVAARTAEIGLLFADGDGDVAGAPLDEARRVRAAVCLAARAGDSLDRFIAALGADPDVEQFAVVRGSATLRLADIDVTVSTASDGRIAGISFGPGFELPVDGVSIGDTADTLREERGAPQREWPFPHSDAVMIWDTPTFLRVDLDRRTGRIKAIHR